MGQHRRKYADEFKAAAVERLYEPDAIQGSVAKGLGITGTPLKTWRLEIEAFGSAEAKRRHQADAAELARLMKENKVSPRLNERRKPVTTDSNHKMSPSPNLLEQEFHCLTPNTVWLADITHIHTDEGWLYLAGVNDMATREIVGWSMEDHMRAELCCDALSMALGRRGPVSGLIHHSDRDSQYAGTEYRKLIKKAGRCQRSYSPHQSALSSDIVIDESPAAFGPSKAASAS